MYNQHDYEYLQHLINLWREQWKIDRTFISSRRLYESLCKGETMSWAKYSSFFDL